MRNPEVGTDGLEVALEKLAVVYLAEQTRAFVVVAVVVVAGSA